MLEYARTMFRFNTGSVPALLRTSPVFLRITEIMAIWADVGYGQKWFGYDRQDSWLLLVSALLIAFGLGWSLNLAWQAALAGERAT